MLQIVRQLTWRHAIFSLKTFVAAILALYIAFRLNLPKPSWSMTTAYIVSQPLAGMVLAKSFYRILGTLVGATASLVFVALFSNAPELFCLALSLWIGTGIFVSLYLRDAPQAYAGMLSGYSAAIIGLPAALAPESAFYFAEERCLEIMLGIACGTLMHQVVFPQRAGDTFRKILHAILPDMARWINDSLLGQPSREKALEDQRKIIATMVSLDSLRVFASLDTPTIRAVGGVVRQLEGKLLSILALLVSLYDKLVLITRHKPQVATRLRSFVELVAVHVAASSTATTAAQSAEEAATEAELVARIEAELPPRSVLRGNPNAFLVRSILLRLIDILTMWREAVWLRTHISAGTELPNQTVPTFEPYRDPTLALIGGLVSAAAVLIASTFWIATAWPSGPIAVTFAGVMCAIAGSRDNPATITGIFLKMSVVGALVAAFYLFVVLPSLTTFAALVVALAPLYLVCGLVWTVPAGAPFVLPIIFIGSGLIGISNQMHYDFAAFLDSFFGYIVGIWIAALALTLLRPLSARWTVRRLIRGMMADLADTADVSQTEFRSRFESRMFDRINALLMRLDPAIPEQGSVMQGSLACLRVGLNILGLRERRSLLEASAAEAIETSLLALRAHFIEVTHAGDAASTLLPVLEAARERILSFNEDALLTSKAEYLYNIEIALRQHPRFFGLQKAQSPVAPATLATA